MRKIPLTQGKFALIDDEDFERINQHLWYFDKKSRYAMRKPVKVLVMHRVIMNAPSDLQVDHINGDRLDNRKCNLRLCTNQQNQANAKIAKNNTSGFKGVFFTNKKWQATIWHNYQPIYLGRFTNILDAARAYNEKAKELFGDFARLNEIPE